jgi:dienelactone hydrolase
LCIYTANYSLGYWERDDLGAVVDYLRASGDVGAIALWGRSMGAATALLHGDRDPSIAAMVSHCSLAMCIHSTCIDMA